MIDEQRLASGIVSPRTMDIRRSPVFLEMVENGNIRSILSLDSVIKRASVLDRLFGCFFVPPRSQTNTEELYSNPGGSGGGGEICRQVCTRTCRQTARDNNLIGGGLVATTAAVGFFGGAGIGGLILGIADGLAAAGNVHYQGQQEEECQDDCQIDCVGQP